VYVLKIKELIGYLHFEFWDCLCFRKKCL